MIFEGASLDFYTKHAELESEATRNHRVVVESVLDPQASSSVCSLACDTVDSFGEHLVICYNHRRRDPHLYHCSLKHL